MHLQSEEWGAPRLALSTLSTHPAHWPAGHVAACLRSNHPRWGLAGWLGLV